MSKKRKLSNAYFCVNSLEKEEFEECKHFGFKEINFFSLHSTKIGYQNKSLKMNSIEIIKFREHTMKENSFYCELKLKTENWNIFSYFVSRFSQSEALKTFIPRILDRLIKEKYIQVEKIPKQLLKVEKKEQRKKPKFDEENQRCIWEPKTTINNIKIKEINSKSKDCICLILKLKFDPQNISFDLEMKWCFILLELETKQTILGQQSAFISTLG